MASAAASSKASAANTRSRLIQAALKIVEQEGLHGATTRGIAEKAGVSEVTLFRHFRSKEELLTSMMREVVRINPDTDIGDKQEWTTDLEKNLLRFGRALYAGLVHDEMLIRTMIGESKRHRDFARQVIQEASQPILNRFIGCLETARQAGLVRKDVDLKTTVDVFTAMLLSGMLRITANINQGYTSEEYVKTCIKIFAAGLAPQSPFR